MTDIKRMDMIHRIEPLHPALIDLYAEVFAEVDSLAAQRHMLEPEELSVILMDGWVQKWIAFDDANHPIGLAVITNNLHAWPLISPRFFARIEPERYATGKIWYVGFVGARGGQASVFADLIAAMAPQVIEPGGMTVMDFCHYNVAVRQIPRVTGLLLRRLARGHGRRAVAREIDTQTFMAWMFPHAP